jgi:hypothetical protein
MERLYHVVVAVLGAFISGRLADVLFWLGYRFLKQLFNFYFFEFFFFFFIVLVPTDTFLHLPYPHLSNTPATLYCYTSACARALKRAKES